MEKKSAWKKYSAAEVRKLDKLCDSYRDFLSVSKTERECVDYFVNEAEKAGYRELESLIGTKTKLKAGDKIYSVMMNKSIVLFQLGKRPITEGMNILGAHLDSPRMDLKPNPLYEKADIAYLDTHYYGGIKKYQWVTIPLALHGVVVKKDGTTIDICIGEDEDDPVFFVSDLLIHLAADQMEKKGAKVIEGEALDLIVGNRPISIAPAAKGAKAKGEVKETKDAVKAGVLDILKKQYDIEEEDFLSAEIEVVPAGRARDAGFDRSLILGYGQDDKVCAYTSFRAMLDAGSVDRTMCCILVDKEEIGSVGATGMQSHFFENSIAELLNLLGEYSELNVRRTLARSAMLSSDVNAAYDPSYESAYDAKNTSNMGGGMVFNKYTGSRGKGGSNDANAEYIAHIRNVLDGDKIQYQFAELGKVDQGGGGTIAYILARYGMNVIDAGIAVLNMHAPWEATSKADIYETYRGYISFVKGVTI